MMAAPLSINNPSRWFGWFALGQFLLWVIVPTLAYSNLPLDVVEGLAWGHGWPVGTYKHPPLQAWILEIAAIVGGRHDAAIYATGAGCLLLTYIALWRMARMVLSPAVALAGIVTLAACFYFATTIPEFNPNVVQMPLFALCGWLFWRCYQQDRWWDWGLFGLCAGLGMLGKYSFALMLLSIGGFMVLEPSARRLIRRPGAYLALFVGAVVFTPHLLWLVQSHWLPLDYATSRIVATHGWLDRVLGLMRFVGAQALAIALPLVILWLARSREAMATAVDPAFRCYLTCLAWLPTLLILGMGLIIGGLGREMWGMALWPFIGLWAAERWRSDLSLKKWPQVLLATSMAVMPMATVSGALLSVPFGFRAWRTEFPGRELATEAENFWQAQGWRQPLLFVLGDAWHGGNIAWYGQDRPQLMINGNTVYSPWVRPADVALHGALAVWDPDGGGEKTPDWAVALGQVAAIKTATLHYGKQEIRARFAIIMPAPVMGR
jgi:4-amino-4-deoxy-L-arabinose transferase-like glycosyltransferase